MDSNRSRRLAIGLLLRTLMLGALAYVLSSLLTTHFYATMLVICGTVAIVVFDVVQLIHTAQLMGAHSPDSDVNAVALHRQRALERTNTLLDTVAAALLVLNADGRVVLVNRAARRLAGIQTDRLHHLASIGSEAAQEIEALAPGARRIVRLADGQQVLAIAAQFFIPGEAPQRLVSLQRVAGELDAVEVKAWQDVSRVLAHEMMNSLTPISSLSHSLEALFREALQRPNDATDEIAGALEAIRRRSDGLMNFVERYRRIAELPELQVQAVSLEHLLSGIERLMRTTFQQKGIVYRRATTCDLQFHADPALIEQALLNLIRNAMDACAGEPGPQVELMCELREEQVFLSVTDNGHGLDDSARSQLFVPFFTTKPDGAGIGLNFARQVALAHGGRLEVQANERHGARFTLVLPALRPASSSMK